MSFADHIHNYKHSYTGERMRVHLRSRDIDVDGERKETTTHERRYSVVDHFAFGFLRCISVELAERIIIDRIERKCASRLSIDLVDWGVRETRRWKFCGNFW